MKAAVLPPETLCEILSYFSATLTVNRTSSFPWYLGHICTSWRAVFLHQFWTSININWWSHSAGRLYVPWERVLELVQTFLVRTQGRLFTFKFISPFNRDFQTSHSHRTLRTLMDHSDRWAGASLRIYESYLPLLQLVKGRLPHLRALEIRYNVRGVLEPDCPSIDAFHDAPLLEYAYMNQQVPWAINYTTLHTLHIGELVNTALLLDALRQTRCLQELIVSRALADPLLQECTLPVVLPQVKLFAIGSGGAFLLYLVMPALEDFIVYAISNSQPSILEFLSRGHQIRCFTVDKCSSADTCAFLEYMPGLISLSLCYVYPISVMFTHLTHNHHYYGKDGEMTATVGPTIRPVLTGLRTLSITGPLVGNEVIELMEMVGSRLWTTASTSAGVGITPPMEVGIQELSVHLANYEWSHPLVMPVLHTIKERGVKLLVDRDQQDFHVQLAQRSRSFDLYHSKRAGVPWAGASLRIFGSELPLLQLVKGRLPHLRTPWIHGPHHPYIDAFHDASLLEHVYLKRQCLGAIDSAAFRTLHICELSNTALFLDLLRQMHCLQELIVSLVRAATFLPKSMIPVVLPHVKLFAVGGDIPLFPYLAMPALEDFSMYTSCDNHNFHSSALEFLSRHR
ncbi:hypothetical protein AMATHDRAFT_8062 [Amanita thiersii Skay4041]|uniref:F-box domain-containing protein n=1 Tax=Amanita thiersii Skay4041 TaxID=703135 RepID=A0A2A9N7A6_9AGAR|nr:hypothetical protein AMATHDRAFT_8062 [Amanita thiersii Skay4041]